MRSWTLAFLAGSVLALNFPAPPPLAAFAALGAAGLAAACWPLARVPACLLAGCLWTGLAAGAAASGVLARSLEGEDFLVTGRVEDVPVLAGTRLRFRFRIERLVEGPGPGSPAPGAEGQGPGRPGSGRQAQPALAALADMQVRLSWYGPPTPPRAGERWRLRLRLRRPRGLSNPGGFDFEQHALSSGLGAVGYVRGDPRTLRLADPAWWSLAARRQALAERLDAVVAPGPARAVIKALALGIRSDLSPRQWRTLRETGTAHLVAISGLHVGLVALIAGLVGSRAWACSAWLAVRVPAPRAGLVMALAAATGYAALAGFTVPTRRALVMFGVVVVARLAGRHVAASSVLAFACAAVLALDPLAVGSAGFWLSFSAVAAIALGIVSRLGPSAHHGRALGWWWRWGRVHPLVALGVAPAGIALLGEGAPLAPIANLIAVPWVSMVVVPASLLATLCVAAWPAAAAALAAVATAALDLLWPALELIAALGGEGVGGPESTSAVAGDRASGTASWWVPGAVGALLDAMLRQMVPGLVAAAPRPGPLALAAATVGFVLVVLPGPGRVRLLGLCWLAPLALARLPALAPGELDVTVLDVGQGLSVVVRSASGWSVYDAGPRWPGGFDAGRDVVARYLAGRGARRIDELIVSHGDIDHAGGATGLRERLPVRSAIGDPVSLARPREPCRHGRAWTRDGLHFALLRVDGSGSENDRSCVLRIDGPAGTVLLPGDVEAGAERELLAHLDGAAPLALLVAAHHGSATSSTAAFLEALRPGHVAISAGHRNRFGFPHADVLSRFDEARATVHVTGACGALRYRLVPGRPTAVTCWRDVASRPWRRATVTPSPRAP